MAISNFLTTFNKLDKDNLHLLKTMYCQEVTFEDPIHKMQGLTVLEDYFRKMYANVTFIQFDFDEIIQQEQLATVRWRMHFEHAKLKHGKRITVNGITFLRFNAIEKELIEYHRDYFDLGEMLYDNIPILGHLTRKIKSGMV